MKTLLSKITRFIRRSLLEGISLKNTALEQVVLTNQYRLMKKLLKPKEMPTFSDIGFASTSQFEEDGILLYIFSLIKSTNRRVVEICAGPGSECMAANLILNHGWEALLFDGDENLVAKGKKYFSGFKSLILNQPKYVHAWITQENINQLITDNGFSGPIDLLSLDIDGIDYYLMEKIDVIQPRVIVCETHNIIPDNLSLTIPYKSNFNHMTGEYPDFMGASALAMQKLLKKKGYRLIGANRYGFNVFFMKNGVGEKYFPAVSIKSIHNNTFTREATIQRWPKVKNLPWVKI
ncbi:MAG: hypothetical protein ACD_40C00213G0023 [uncultured bacterium]|nr:MAG: hypothetical protein ACD_40C00213G0023 [uncultured bacterium]KKU26441.1 MAG: hypothetical protein UX37_C0002G0007 [Microgenomates group bacterium GW2011_GWA2_46_16]